MSNYTSWVQGESPGPAPTLVAFGFDFNQPRDDHGRWTDTGASNTSDSGGEPAAPLAPVKHRHHGRYDFRPDPVDRDAGGAGEHQGGRFIRVADTAPAAPAPAPPQPAAPGSPSAAPSQPSATPQPAPTSSGLAKIAHPTHKSAHLTHKGVHPHPIHKSPHQTHVHQNHKITVGPPVKPGLNGNGYVPQDDDVELLARLMFAESAQTPEAYSHIGWAIVNRVGAHGFPKTLEGVVYKHNQYTSVGGPLWRQFADESSMDSITKDSYAQAKDVAARILSGKVSDPTKGATYLYSSKTGAPPKGFFSDGTKSGSLVRTLSYGLFTFLKEP